MSWPRAAATVGSWLRDAWHVTRGEHAIRRTVVMYVTLFVVAHALLGSPRGLAYAAFVAVGAIVTAGIHARHPLPRRVLWAMVALGLLHCAGGLLPSPDPRQLILYETWLVPGALKLDQLVHAYGVGAITWVGWHASGRRTVALAWGVGAGVLNEIVEWLLNLALPTMVGNLTNATWDMVFNVVGGLIVLLLVDASPDTTKPGAGPGFVFARTPQGASTQSASPTS